MKVIGLPFSHYDKAVNISSPQGAERAPESIEAIYYYWQQCGVSFLSGHGLEYQLSFKHFHNLSADGRDLSVPRIADGSNDLMMITTVADKEFDSADGQRVCFLGGDNSISYATLSAYRRHCNRQGKKHVLVVTLDAHPDLCDKGANAPFHSDWLRFAIERDGLNPRHVLGIGWRDIEPQEYQFAKSRKIRHIPMREIHSLTPYQLMCMVDSFLESMSQGLGPNFGIYLDIDFDVFDPSYAPGVSTVSPLGLRQDCAITLIQYLAGLNNLGAVSMVEINPSRDVNRMTQELALRLVGEFAARVR